MATQTDNLHLNLFMENEAVDFEQINENFQIIDDSIVCVESDVKTASYSGGESGTANWYYKKFSDGTVEMSAKLEFSNLKCDKGSSAPYYSGAQDGGTVVNFPFALSRVDSVQMHLSSNTIGWVSDITNRSVSNKVEFRVMSMGYESTGIYKQVFISVKGAI